MRIVKTIQDVWAPKPPVDLAAEIKFNAAKFDISPKIVASIIYQESAGDEEAKRVEDGFYDRYLKGKTRKDLVGYVPNFPPTLNTELRDRATSWGVMQVLGETARLMGYQERWLSKVRLTPDNVFIGCKYLRHLLDIAGKISGDRAKWVFVFSKWNGSNKYPQIIFDHLEKERWRVILP